MKKLSLILTFVLILTSCHRLHKYQYVVDSGIEGGEPFIMEIYARNDTLAYLEAYKQYIEAKKEFLEGNIKNANKIPGTDIEIEDIWPEPFKLFNSDSIEITNIQFATRNTNNLMKQEQDIDAKIQKRKDEQAELKRRKEEEKIRKEEEIKNLLPYFNIKKDEFSSDNTAWCTPKDAPKYVDMQGIYCYFMQDDRGVSNLRLKIQYVAKEWLFIKEVRFSINDKAYAFVPTKVKHDHEAYRIWEWIDENVDNSKIFTEIIKAFMDCDTAKMQLVGSNYSKTITLSSKEIESIKRTIQLYLIMGGKLYN